jgi:hypothetical protein
MTFTDEERRVYKCPLTDRYHDPLAARRAMLARAGGAAKFNEAIKDSRSADPDVRDRGEAALVAAGRAALGLEPVDPRTGAGVPEAVVLEALTAFTRWLAGKGETVPAGPSGAPCTGCPTGH